MNLDLTLKHRISKFEKGASDKNSHPELLTGHKCASMFENCLANAGYHTKVIGYVGGRVVHTVEQFTEVSSLDEVHVD